MCQQGAEGKPHVAALGLQSLCFTCVTQLVTAFHLQHASYGKSFYHSNMAWTRTQMQFLIKRNGMLIDHLKNNYVYHLIDRLLTFYHEKPIVVWEVEFIFMNCWEAEAYPNAFNTALHNYLIFWTKPLHLSIIYLFYKQKGFDSRKLNGQCCSPSPNACSAKCSSVKK